MIEKVLALDSLVGFLSLKERIWLQLERRDVYVLTRRSINRSLILKELILKHRWEPPKRKYNDSRQEVWLNTKTGNWEPIEKYHHPILTELQTLIK